MKYVVSDFDGTLTTSDSLLKIIIYQRGRIGLLLALARLLPWLVLMKLRLYSNQRTKERLLYHCFGKMTQQEFELFTQRFADTHRHILRHDLYEHLLKQQRSGEAEVIVVTASPRIWVSRLVPEFTVIGTEMEWTDSGFAGRFLTSNCYGKEKVRRLQQHIPDLISHRHDHHITAYGDSRGDRELLAYADESFLIK